MKRIGIVTVLTLFACAGLSAGDLYVGPGRTYETIQAAVDDAGSGDVIHVAEGIYDVGATVDAGDSGMSNRVAIVSKTNLKIVGAGRGKTIVRGSRPAGHGDSFRLETAAVRCLRVQNCSDLVISDMTFERGETWCTTLKSGQNGGAIYVTGTWASTVRFVDCDISDSAAPTSGLVEGGTYVRCRLDSGYGYYSAVADKATFVNCAISRSATYNNAQCHLFRDCSLYNCTISDCKANNLFNTTSKAVNSLIVLFSGSYLPSGGDPASVLTDCVRGDTAAHGEWQVMAPTLGDMSPLPAADVFGAGTYANLDEVSLPAGISKYVDLNGQPIVADGSGKITAGAVQAAGVPAAGMLVLTNAYHTVNGNASRNEKLLTWVCPTSYPVQYKVSATPKQGRLFRWQRSIDSDYQYPSMDGSEWLMPSPDTSVTLTYKADNVTDCIWVDAKEGDDATGKMNNEGLPFKTIQAAVTLAAATWNRIIFVKPGVYTNGVSTPFTAGGKTYGEHTRFAVNSGKLLIRSTDGADVTVIEGLAAEPEKQDDPVNYPGCGEGALYTACLRQSCALQGFTIRNSYASADGDPIIACMTYGTVSPQILDCVFSNSVARAAGVGAYCTRCRFINNVTMNDVANGKCSACYFRGNTTVNPNFGACREAAIFCTLVGTPKDGNLSTQVSSFNSVWDGGNLVGSNWKPYGSLFWNYAGCNVPPSTFIHEDPQFVDRVNSPRLAGSSPAVAAGVSPTVENCTTSGINWYLYCHGDLEGNAIDWTGGTPTIGACQKTVPCAFIEMPEFGGLEFHGVAPGLHPLETLPDFTITPDEGTRPCIGVTVNDEPRHFTNSWPYVISVSAADAKDGALVVAPIYSNDWYADDDGDDANSGFLPKLAKKTLATAEAMLSGGDTLWVLPGTYDAGSNRVNAAETIWSRLVVQNGHAVVSTDGPEETVIVGADATIDPDDYGCGTNAIRCAMVCRNGTLSGFTLTGGRVNRSFGNKPDGMGAGVIGETSNGTTPSYRMRVENCIISNCVAAVGAGATRVQLARSRVLGNRATSYGPGAYSACQYGCLFSGNIGTGVIDHPSTTVGCTVAADNLTAAGAVATAFQSAGGGVLVANTLFCAPISHTSENVLTLSHCAYPDTSALTGANITITDCVETNVEALAIDNAGVPVIGSNAAIDKGDPEAFDDSTYAFLDPAHDLYGFQRVMNGAMDIGCCEGDWSRRYAKDLGSAKYVTVSDVSPEVVENAEKKIDLPASATLTLTWAVHPGSSAPRILSFVVTSGTLTVARAGGETVVCPASPDVQTVVLPGDADERLVLSTSEDGAATLLSCRRQAGMMLIFR